ncbi:hypothetical protein Cob_v002257 [Colletotrichum orbiculare MAFF 240422]|uniref:Uncharacterized protein n=1 Tax=Colletotrichum orbiculare (strain 104-T / ATCC 96160 / CBS 514.97 / LARS 414 / MAFF 240422) TaxID=1213857 RepID=A0A484G2X6_COLOR|nr:hypothetical protein Cob_v002257 [Colletotrichum orbiculare MAFF 240422]
MRLPWDQNQNQHHQSTLESAHEYGEKGIESQSRPRLSYHTAPWQVSVSLSLSLSCPGCWLVLPLMTASRPNRQPTLTVRPGT